MTVAVAIGWISVVLDMLGAISLFALAGSDEFLDALGVQAGTVRGAAIGMLVGGAVLALVVYLLSKGSSIARFLVSVVMVVRIAASIWLLVAFGTHQLAEAVASIVVALVALGLLWNGKANAFFASNAP